jgi:methylmalonyl-CoA/ethylmalonyl-CoA epimerase
VLGLKFEGAETVAEQKVKTAFFPVGESEVELLESTAPDGPVAKFIEKKGQGFQHVAFRVANIDEALEELKEKTFSSLTKPPGSVPAEPGSLFCTPKPPAASW